MRKDWFLIFRDNQDTNALPSLKDYLVYFVIILPVFIQYFIDF
jgi:hypothetical protein